MQSQQISWSPTLDNLVTALVVPDSLFKTVFRKVSIVGALLSDNLVLFGKTDVLETLTNEVEQCWTNFREPDELLGLKSCLIGCNVPGSIQVVMLCTKHMAFQKTLMSSVRIVAFKTYFNTL
jgi:hypothetical protein